MIDSLPPVSVIIPTLNEEKYLPILLESICHINHPLEIIVVDAHSDDKTVVVAESWRDRLSPKKLTILNSNVRLIANQRNAGAKSATHEVLLFCDADIIVPDSETFSRIIENFVDNNYAIATAKIVALENILMAKILIFIALKIQNLLHWFGKAYFSGAFLLTSKKVFTEAGGFDETLRISEDIDFSTRASKLGRIKIYNVPIKTSMRRIEKYGYGVLYDNPKAIWELLIRGKQTERENKINYPFGNF